MADEKTIPWKDIDKRIAGLVTDVEHDIRVQREAIPIVFVPGIMGTCLRLKGTDGTGKTGKLPNLRWDPSHPKTWMLPKMAGASGSKRKKYLVGSHFDSNLLEANDSKPPGDGFIAIMQDYCDNFLTPLKTHDWGALSKIFEFPVYAVGYNWTDSAANSGKKLAARISEIIAEAKGTVGLCEKVILLSHSMGGLVCRAASELSGAASSILGIVHVVQPATGTPAAYWRMKAGFEGPRIASSVLGSSAREVTPVLGNIPGGLQLLPNKLHRTNTGVREWLTVTEGGSRVVALPQSDPYNEIYRLKAVVKPADGVKPSNNAYWGLVDPDLLDPDYQPPAKPPNARDQVVVAKLPPDPWADFIAQLKIAEHFHTALGIRQHPETFCLRGVGSQTADVIELRITTRWPAVNRNPYSKQGFAGFFTDANGKSMQAMLQGPAGDGDGTVARSSAAALDGKQKQLPGDRALKTEHQNAYENSLVQKFVYQAIIAICKKRYESLRHPLGDYPAPSSQHT